MDTFPKQSFRLILSRIAPLSLIFSSIVVSPSLGDEAASPSKGINVYASIPGISPSTRFSARVSDGSNWRDLFTMETVGPKKGSSEVYSSGIYEAVTGHSASWCTFEMDVPVTVEVTKLSPGDIQKCIIRPLSRQIKPIIAEDKRSVRFDIKPRFADGRQVPVNIAVEINGQTHEMMTVFASPHLEGKPSPDDPGVLKVSPGTMPPIDGDWKTLYFMPGVHDLGSEGFLLRADTQYYVPGDAWVDGAFGKWKRANNARVFGLGVLSGRKISWAEVEKDFERGGRPVELFGTNATLEGISIIDSPHHSIMAGSADPNQPAIIRNVKLHNWRLNTDGIHFFGSGIAEDCFFHTQDDSHYLAGNAEMVRFRRMVYWRDETFGVDIILTAGGSQEKPNDAIAEDSDSIYNKSIWGGIHIDSRGLNTSNWIDGVIIRDLRIEDPCKNKPLFRFLLTGQPSSLKNVLLKNIEAHSDNGHPFEFYGAGPEALIENITFEDIKVGDRYIEDFSRKNFKLAFVRNFKIVRDGKVVATHSSDPVAEAKAYRPDPKNLLVNPSFELHEFGWKGAQAVSGEITEPSEGELAARASFKNRKIVMQQLADQISLQHGIQPWRDRKMKFTNPGTVPNIPYEVTAWMKTDGEQVEGQVGFEFTFQPREGKERIIQKVTVPSVPLPPGEWVKVSGVVTLPWDYDKYSALRTCNFFATATGRSGNFYFDNCSVIPLAPVAGEQSPTTPATGTDQTE